MKTKKTSGSKRLQVNVELRGEAAERFLTYKQKELLQTNAAAGFKLLVERLNQVVPTSPQAPS